MEVGLLGRVIVAYSPTSAHIDGADNDHPRQAEARPPFSKKCRSVCIDTSLFADPL